MRGRVDESFLDDPLMPLRNVDVLRHARTPTGESIEECVAASIRNVRVGSSRSSFSVELGSARFYVSVERAPRFPSSRSAS